MKLKDVLRQYDEQSLYFYARDLGIQATKDIFPEELCQTMVERILNDHHIEKRLSILDDQTYQVFLQVLSDEEIEEKDNLFLERLLDYDLIAFEGNELFVVEEVKEIILPTRTFTEGVVITVPTGSNTLLGRVFNCTVSKVTLVERVL